MLLKSLVVLSALVSASAFAQAPLGTVSKVEGVVTATQGASGVNVTPGMAVQNGMRFVTTSRSTVTLNLASGCVVTVPPSSAVTVSSTMTCQQLMAAVQPVVPVAAQGAFQGGNGINYLIGAGGVGVTAGAISVWTDDKDNNNNDNRPISGQ